jgi:transketolase C-terminal domain/subunit
MRRTWQASLTPFTRFPGPTYIRGLRGEVPQLFGTPLELGRHRTIFDGEDVLVIVSGHLTAATQLIVSELRASSSRVGISQCSHAKALR